MKKHLILLIGCFLSVGIYAQTIRGKVSSGTDGEPLVGVSVTVKGTTYGSMTDINGSFSINAVPTDIIVFTYIGFQTSEILVGDQKTINVTLEEKTEFLDEVIVIGYGVQRKSVVTSAIARVTSGDLLNVAPIRVDNSLKGLTSGVTVTSSSGQPGEGAQVRIRGIGTINNSDPLYIVDGMPIDGGIDFLNPNDVLSIEVLKDAASSAVYGTRGANGVILVTTKSGIKGKMKVTYDFSYGLQNSWKKLGVLNATEYAIIMNEGYMNGGNTPPYADPYSYGKGTDWQQEVFNKNAPISNHQLSISGGSDRLNYYISAGYINQEGIVGGNWDRSNYERLSLRSNTTYNLLDEKNRNFLNKFTFGMNIAYSHVNSTGITNNSEYGSILGSAISFSPILGVYATDQTATLAAYPNAVKDPNNGLVYTVAGASYNEIVNPIAMLSLPGEKGYSDKFVANFWGELTIWDNLKFRSSLGIDMPFWETTGWTPIYYLGQSRYATKSSVYSQMNRSLVWQIENVFTYEKQFFDVHNLQLMAGQSAKKTTGRYLYGYSQNMIEQDGNRANIDFTTGSSVNGERNTTGSAYSPHTLASYFTRLSYNYAERYILQATVRQDGSSRFGKNNLWMTFPSASVGWNIMNESFMENRPLWLTTSKIRASWGKNGNENMDDFKFAVLTLTGENYPFGTGDGTLYTGTKQDGLANPDLKWETSVQTDLGIDLGFINNSILFSVDYYIKKTEGMLMQIPVPNYVGETKPWGNVGTMENRGVEFDASYRFKAKDWTFRISANASWLQNKLINLGNEEGFSNYDNYQNVGAISRAENGYTFPFFYGFRTNGIFQNQDEINAYRASDGSLIQPNAVPGDVRFVDLDNSGKIDDKDKTMIGKGMPDWTFGGSLNVAWRNFDFSMIVQGTYGNDIFDATRRTDIAYINLPTWILNRWTGEGTSNTIPRFTFTDNNNNWLSSDLYIKDGSYIRLKNIIVGYTIPTNLTEKAFISSLRFYVSAENLLTLTKYSGFDPEISSGGTSLGIDRGVYPQARTFTFGLNVSF